MTLQCPECSSTYSQAGWLRRHLVDAHDYSPENAHEKACLIAAAAGVPTPSTPPKPARPTPPEAARPREDGPAEILGAIMDQMADDLELYSTLATTAIRAAYQAIERMRPLRKAYIEARHKLRELQAELDAIRGDCHGG